MPFPALDLFPSDTLFPGDPIPVDVGGGYSQLIECAANGLVLTATDEFGIDWVQDTLEGWYGAPGSTIQTTPKVRAPGSWPGPRETGERTITIGGYSEAISPSLVVPAMDRFNSAISKDAFLLTVADTDGSVRSAIAYRNQQALDAVRVSDVGFEWSAQLLCTEPRRFGAALSEQTGLPSSSGGLTFPFTFPFDFDSVIESGLVVIENLGNAQGPVTLRIDGPVAAPRVTHVGTGAQIVFAADLVLGIGQWITVDMENQTALANGTATRAGFLTQAGWFGLEPGVNTFAFAADGDWPQAKLTVSATPAWQ